MLHPDHAAAALGLGLLLLSACGQNAVSGAGGAGTAGVSTGGAASGGRVNGGAGASGAPSSGGAVNGGGSGGTSAMGGAAGGTSGGVPIIVDTDIYGDVDDVGALAILNAMADHGEARILGVVVNTPSKWGAPCVNVINTYYGRGSVPIGTLKPNDSSSSNYPQTLVQSFPNALQDGSAAPEAVGTYRKLLASQPAQSVVVVSIGFLTNLAALLKSPGDATSSNTGVALVTEKVKKLVVMGGQYPSGHEYNFYGDPAATQAVVANWPTAIVFDGFEVGESLVTGAVLGTTPATNPVRKAYEIYVGAGNGRSSWDLTAVFYAVRGPGSFFTEVTGGTNVVAADGSNQWQTGTGSKQSYLVKAASDASIGSAIDSLLTQAPAAP